MQWILFLTQLPATPSSLRVSVWRKLRAAGALGLQNGAWLLPDRPEQARFVQDLLAAIQGQGASGLLFSVAPLGSELEQNLLARFRAERAEEYGELLEHCRNFLAEMDNESRRERFTFAELEENEQDLQRLGGWLEKIQKRDFSGGEEAQAAAQALEACRRAFEAFSNTVYERQASDWEMTKNE